MRPPLLTRTHTFFARCIHFCEFNDVSSSVFAGHRSNLIFFVCSPSPLFSSPLLSAAVHTLPNAQVAVAQLCRPERVAPHGAPLLAGRPPGAHPPRARAPHRRGLVRQVLAERAHARERLCRPHRGHLAIPVPGGGTTCRLPDEEVLLQLSHARAHSLALLEVCPHYRLESSKGELGLPRSRWRRKRLPF